MLTILQACRIAREHGIEINKWELKNTIVPSMRGANEYGAGPNKLDAAKTFSSWMKQEAWERGADAVAASRFERMAYGD